MGDCVGRGVSVDVGMSVGVSESAGVGVCVGFVVTAIGVGVTASGVDVIVDLRQRRCDWDYSLTSPFL